MYQYLSNLLVSNTFLPGLLTNAAVIGVAGWLAKNWADKRLEKIKGAQAKALEETKGKISELSHQLQAGLDKRMMVFETHFKLEFSSYQDLWVCCDNSYVIAKQTLHFFQHQPIDKKAEAEEKSAAIARYEVCRAAFEEVRRKRPFIAKEVAVSSEELVRQCCALAETYKNAFIFELKTTSNGEFFDRKPFINDAAEQLELIESIYETTANLISSRIDRMYVTDFSRGVS